MPRHPVPVFPLPGTVLFPHAVVPLHVFELRYRTMTREALSGERLLALALLKPGWQDDYHGSPDFHPLTCLARIEEVEWLPNDCYNLHVTGITRARVTRIVREYPYRSARVEAVPQAPYPEDDPLVEVEKQAVAETYERLLAAAGAGPAAARVDRALRYEVLVNALCMGIDLPAEQRYALLELDSVLERGKQIRDLAERQLRGRAQPPRSEAEGGERN